MRASQLSSARAVAYVAGKSTRINRTLFSRSVSTGHKVIVICLARTPATAKGLTYFFLALRRIEHPFPGLPGRGMAQVLGVPARQLDDPVAFRILPKAEDRRVAGLRRGIFQSGPSV
jgi:hypothetical protein